MLEEEVGVMRNAMTTRAPCGAKKRKENNFVSETRLIVTDKWRISRIKVEHLNTLYKDYMA